MVRRQQIMMWILWQLSCMLIDMMNLMDYGGKLMVG